MNNFCQVLGVTFLFVLMAEAGCFLRTAALVERYGFPGAVCLGTLFANAVLLVPVLMFGDDLHRFVSPLVSRLLSGGVITLMGLLILFGKDL